MSRLFLPALFLFLALVGCTATPQFPQPTAAWRSHSGQLQYITADRRVVGDFIASRHGGDFHFEFSKGGGVPLLKLARHGDLAQAEGVFARGRWRGKADAAPAALRGWIIEVPRAFAAPQLVMRIPGAQAGESFTFILAR